MVCLSPSAFEDPLGPIKPYPVIDRLWSPELYPREHFSKTHDLRVGEPPGFAFDHRARCVSPVTIGSQPGELAGLVDAHHPNRDRVMERTQPEKPIRLARAFQQDQFAHRHQVLGIPFALEFTDWGPTRYRVGRGED